MLLINSINVLAPCDKPPAGVASVSVWIAKRSGIKIGFHLIFNGIRRVTRVQVIEQMPPP